jgi:MYXO-CTERM domain-containing protein
MGPTRTFVSVALAALLSPLLAHAQRVTLVSRSGAGVTSAGLISARACSTDRWTFRAASGDGARTEAPEVWLARGAACAFDPADTRCVRAVAVTPTREGSCDAGVCWTFTVPGGLLVDPETGSCAVRGVGSTAVLVRFGAVAAAFPDGRIGWDTVAPAPPTSVSVNASAESVLEVAWTSPIAAADAGSVDADVMVDADVTDAEDALDASDASAVADAAEAGDVEEAGVVATSEPLRRYWLLCDPADGVDAGVGECPSGGFAGLDVDDDRTLEDFAGRCARGATAISGTTLSVTLSGLPDGRPYRFAVVAEDLAGNRSPAVRATRCATAQRNTDFWERYRSEGGSAAPGCDVAAGRSGGVGWLWLLGVGVIAARRSRQRSGRPNVTVVAVGTDVRAPAQP